MEKDFEQIIYYATQAPSGHNTQPWKFRVANKAILIYPDYERSLPIVDPDNHALFISLGCALENLIIAAKHFGYQETIYYRFPREEDFIQVDLTKENLGLDNGLFEQIEKRQVTRNRFLDKEISEADLNRLLVIGQENNITLKAFRKNQFASLIPLIEEANLAQFNNSAFKQELMSWVRFNDKTATKSKDGLRGASMGYPGAPSWLGKLFFNLMDSPEKETNKTIALVNSSSLALLFIAEKNNKETWVKLGRSYERIALQAAALGIKHAHVNMPCEEVGVRNKLKQKLDLTTGEPLLLIRLGYAEAMPKSYRRAVEQVLAK